MANFSVKKIILGITAGVVSFVAFGEVLDAITNALDRINWNFTIIGTLVLILLWLALKFCLKRYPINWGKYNITKLNYLYACSFIGIGLLLWTPPILSFIGYSKQETPQKTEIQSPTKPALDDKDKIVILIAEFDGIEPQAYGVSQIIYDQLSEATKSYQSVKIKRLEQSIKSTETAKEKAREFQADIILWGSYLVNQANTRVTIHFDIIEDSFEIPLATNTETYTAEKVKLECFVLQEQLSKEMSYLVLLTIGIVQFRSIQFDDAIITFSKALSLATSQETMIEPQHIYTFRGLSYLMKFMFAEASNDFTKVIDYKPNTENYKARAMAYLFQKDLKRALADINKALSLGKDDQAFNISGFIKMAQGNFEQAFIDFNKALELNPKNPQARLNRGTIYYQQKNYEAALADYNESIRFAPTSSIPYASRASYYENKGEFEKALNDYNKVVELSDWNDYMSYYHRGRFLSIQGQYNKALQDINKSIEINPYFSDAYNIRGNIYVDKGDLDFAIADYTSAIKLNPSEASGYYHNRGRTYNKKGDFAKGLEDLNTALTLIKTQKGSDLPKLSDLYATRCNSYLELEKFNLAIADCNEGIKLDPNNSMLYANRGACFASKQDYTRAMSDFNKSISLDPFNIVAYYNRGLALAEQGEKNRAILDLRKVIQLNSNLHFVSKSKELLCYLGECL